MRRMNRRALLALAALLPSAARAQGTPAALTPRDRADIGRIEAYMNGLKTLKARFLQVAPDGNTSEGTAWVERPGKMRFEYDPPAPFLLVAGYGGLMFHDRKLNQTSNIPLSQTPLGIILAEKVAFGGDVTVAAVDRQPGFIELTLFRTKSPGDGTLRLGFADSPLGLKQWSVIDPQKLETRVTLFNIQLGDRFDSKLFDVTPPKGSGN